MDAMQVLFTAFDTGISSVWREEDRSWRSEERRWRTEDVDFREEERRWRAEEGEMRCNELRWRKEDVEQQHVENARYLWTRWLGFCAIVFLSLSLTDLSPTMPDFSVC
jgi:calcium release-activated calcium channel protein 1